MILGRFSILGVFRHINEFSKQYNSPKRGIFYVGNVSLNKRRKLRESPYREPSVITSYARMASTSHEAGGHSSKKEKNKLAFEKSPYLLQHATNPVNWYPWGDEALEKARREDKLIFLSVGYSTCHWCHVMERESFENEEIAKIMNQFFVSIKVDREERPDIDKIYMTFIQAISGHGGWPMSVFLTPDLTPITGGTYFPPVDKYGQPGFKSVLLTVAHKWLEDKTDVLDSGRRVLDVLKRVVGTDKAAQDEEVPSSDCLHSCVKQLMGGYDKEYGGFTSSPKFPQPVNFNLLFHVYSKDKSSELGKECLNMCIHTLIKMAKGGIHDHVGQGFSRYSVDGKWHVPHFEKMLYDQAQLLRSYSEAFLVTKDPFFSHIVDDIVTYVTRDLRHKEGGFYSAEDADSLPSHDSNAKKEGAFYVWSYGEVEALLSEAISGHDDLLLIDIFCHHFNVKPEGNLKPHQDPHREMEKQNVLIIYGSVEETAEHFKLSIEDTEKYLEEARKILFEARAERPRPHLDDKIITAWNGLMMSGLSYAGLAVKNKKYIEYAEDTARFIERYLFDEQDGLLLRSCYRGDGDAITQIGAPILGFHVDYAFVVKGLLDLYEATFNVHWLEFAERLHDIQDGLFWDSKDGGYFASAKDDLTAILRLKDDHDGAEPSGNSVACGNLLRLASYLNRPELNDKAARLLSSFQSVLTRIPAAVPELISALSLYHDTMTQIYIAGRKGAKDTDELLSVIRERLIPGRVLFFVDGDDSDNILFRKNEVMRNMKSSEGRTTIFVCRNRTCSLPITDRSQLVALLEAGK